MVNMFKRWLAKKTSDMVKLHARLFPSFIAFLSFLNGIKPSRKKFGLQQRHHYSLEYDVLPGKKSFELNNRLAIIL